MDDALNELGAYLADRLGPAVLSWQLALGELSVEIDREQLILHSSFCATIPTAASVA